MKMKLDIENTLTEVALQFHFKINSALKRSGLPMIKMTHIQYIDASEGCPECVFFNLESWSTHKLLMTVDGRLIGEGQDMATAKINQTKYVQGVVEEMTAWQTKKDLYNSLKENEIVFRDYKIKVIGPKRPEFRHDHVWTIHFANGKTSNWYGYSAEDALSNAAPWIVNKKIKAIELNKES